MTKKRLILLSSGALIVLLLAGVAGVTIVSADEPTPTFPAPFGWGSRGFGWAGGMWTLFDAAAEALGLTPEGLFAESHGGKSLDEIAEEQGVEVDAVQEAMNAARAEAMQQAIMQAVEDGKISQEQADWMLEGHEKGFFRMGRGFGRGWGRPCIPAGE
jgi:uncharacterized membrane protein